MRQGRRSPQRARGEADREADPWFTLAMFITAGMILVAWLPHLMAWQPFVGFAAVLAYLLTGISLAIRDSGGSL